jgi:hypothetical protein
MVFADIIFTVSNQKNMRKLLITLVSLITIQKLQSQNVGIGTTTPAYPLTIVTTNGAGDAMSIEKGANSLRIKMDAILGSRIFTSNQNLMLTANPASAFPGDITIKPDGNVGIGADPAYPLDVAGRIRIRHTNNTAGIWFNGSNGNPISFVGNYNDDYVGLYSTGAGWNFVMNVDNGNIGVGTSSPTANLDINGSIRMRGTFPKKGSIMTSDDVNGNANWADPIAFRTSGLVNGNNVSIPEGQWTKVMFNSTASYNLSLNYQPVLSQFLVSENGIYHFDSFLRFQSDHYLGAFSMRLILNRSGALSTIGEYYKTGGYDRPDNSDAQYETGVGGISADVALLQGDVVWVEVYCNEVFGYGPVNMASATLLANSGYTWFNGHLVARY